MAMTITEKILAKHAGTESVRPGEIVQVRPDWLMTNDISGPIAVDVFKSMGAKRVFDPERIFILLDHFTPNKDMNAAKVGGKVRRFAQEQNITHFYDAGYGIEHVVLPESGLIRPGDVVIGGDSHTVTYGGLGAFSTGVGSTDLAGAMALGEIWLKVPETIRFEYVGQPGPWIGGKDFILAAIGRVGVSGALYCAMEFGGEAVRSMAIDDRLTMCNMAIEAGGKSGIVEPDEATIEWLRAVGADMDEAAAEAALALRSDEGCTYRSVITIDAGKMEPQVAAPHLPSNVKPVSELRDVAIDQVIIGSCTNGRIGDLRTAAKVLKGRRVNKWVRTLVIPGSQKVFKQALKEGLIDVFVDAGAIVTCPTCGPCFGGHTGALDAGERCVSTTNRNFVGRMGHETSEVYLAGPAVAAASAVAGRIAHPEEV
ncbi:MAG: 3-isopropylmalate dehydratase large subunit [Firmicutes bacterium]|jgi:3-isopropylmalate/(R)-2-methylmalate dehydratase large subunit|nr:3-isopropylmalate dehydratase large subunit [Bacillota bacterium]